MELQEQWGNKWARIATQLPGRTENDVKNFWGSTRWKQLTGIASDLNHRQNSAHSQPLPPPPQAQNAYASHILIQDSFTDDPLPQFDGVVDEYLGPRFMNYSPPRLKLDELPWSLDNCSPPMLELDELASTLLRRDEVGAGDGVAMATGQLRRVTARHVRFHGAATAATHHPLVLDTVWPGPPLACPTSPTTYGRQELLEHQQGLVGQLEFGMYWVNMMSVLHLVDDVQASSASAGPSAAAASSASAVQAAAAHYRR
ncbi:hypothetical protein ZIOFF_060747 [Zingiber officinale]|uniref:Uncharacterized protein n=1 Tax=Zingiber officinale TaxID=94328 RepID=A0A8J5FPH3_ZINOF|nr:hypothetical protein ZIOFF_060747 [Zingiber officinale]